ncbi:MAG: metallophosphoesterase [Oligoflexia bacterium]|nr:metallophosphoesterase [Oligoflexia bacterium]
MLVLASLLFLNIAGASKDTFQIKPYLHFHNNQSINVSWQYKKAQPEHFTIPLDQACGFEEKFYQLSGMKLPQKIKSIPCLGGSETLRLSFLADTQEGFETNQAFGEMIESFDSHSVVLGGDIIQNADDDDEWKALFKAFEKTLSQRVLVPVIGNHEYRGDSDAKNWEKYFGFNANEAFYSIWLGPVKLIVLSSNFEDDPSMVLRQLKWLEEELKKPAPWKFVVFHHPMFSKSIMHMSFYWRKEYLPLRQYYLPLFEKHKVDVVLNGHSHIYEHSLKDGIHYITTGAAGGKFGKEGGSNPFEIKSALDRTLIQFEIGLTALRMNAINLDGKTIDDLYLRK